MVYEIHSRKPPPHQRRCDPQAVTLAGAPARKRLSCHQRNFAAEFDRDRNGHCDRHRHHMIGTPSNPMPSPEEVQQDVQRLLALRPPTDPATGMMQYDTEQAHEYREALRDIVDQYGSIEDFQEAARLPDPAAVSGPELASAAAPDVPGSYSLANGPPAPNLMAGGPGVPAASSLAAFAKNMMGSGPAPAAGGMAQNAGPPALMPRRGTGTIL